MIGFSLRNLSLIYLVCACLLCRLCDAQDEKRTPPSEDQRLEVMKILQEVYKPEYLAAETTEAKSALAIKILETAKETADDAARYSMLKLSSDIAIQAANIAIVSEAIDLMDQLFEIDEPKVRLAALMATIKNITKSSEPTALVAVTDYCRRAIDRNDYVAATQLLDLSMLHFHEVSARQTLQEVSEDIKTIQQQFESVRDQLRVLLEDPDDPQANLAVGKFRCFSRNEWGTGLKNLAKGSDQTLREIATLELKGLDEVQRKAALADRWWEYADELEAEQANQAKLHAASYYENVLGSLQGLQQAKAVKRLQEAESLGDIISVDIIGVDEVPMKVDVPEPMEEWKTTYEMPASFSDVAVGGAGRYLIFRLDALKKLAFFDVFKREIVEYVPIESSDVRFTAGAKEFYIATRPQNVLERWSLETFKRLSTVKLPLENPVEIIMTGSASEGPIYVGAQNEMGAFLNSRSLKPISYQVIDHRYQRAGEIQGAGPESRVRASANGRSFAMWRTNVSPGGFRTYVLSDPIAHTFYQHDTMGYIEPSPDGELMYTSRGVYTNQTKDFLANEGNFATSFRIPAVTGNYAIGVLRDDDQKNKNASLIHILVSGQADPILTIPDVAIRAGEYGDFHGRENLTLARRVYFLPNANLLITLPVSNKSLVLHYFDLEQKLRESGVDFLYVASRAPASVRSGGFYKYQLDVKSKNGNIKYEVVAGPSSMRVSKDGLLTWRIPRGSNEQHEVIVSITDGKNQQATHTFTVTTLP